MTMLVRDGLTILPAWQIAASSAIQILFAVGAIWMAGRAFRLGMLLYGRRLQWREICIGLQDKTEDQMQMYDEEEVSL